MKKVFSALLLSVMIFTTSITNNKAYALENNMQAAWIATAWGIDWPRSKNSQIQQQEMIQILDTLKDTGINTIMFQVRPKADALYKSNINPFSDVLTGQQGDDPGYDPLAFVISEAKKRGMKVHAWLNPYRITHESDHKNGVVDTSVLSDGHPAKLNPKMALSYGGKLYYNPDLPEVKQHISDTVAEIVRNYDVDGIVFDDYFYPTNYPLPPGESRDGAVANARREHINQMILSVKNTIKSIKPNVKFGVSPFGIWKNKSSDPMGSDTSSKATESYYAHSADTVKWIKNGYIDYVIPQVYWDTNHSLAPYKPVTDWWANIVKGTNVDLYIGHNTTEDYSKCAAEIDQQLIYNRKHPTIKGSAYYNTKSLMDNVQGARDKIKNTINSYSPLWDINDSWAKEQILDFYNKGYINGNENGAFEPTKSITRGEFVKIFNRVFGLTSKSGIVFNDTVNNWAKNEIDIAVTNGVAKGKGDGTFGPNDPITRQEAAKMLGNYLKISDSNHDKIQVFPDYNQIDTWAINELEATVEYGYIKGTDQGILAPKSNMSKAEAVVMLNRVK